MLGSLPPAEVLFIRLFGPLDARFADGRELNVSGGRQRALLGLLASAPDLLRDRAWVIDKLWSDASPARARANLRQLLHGLKQSWGADFERLVLTRPDRIGLDGAHVKLVGQPEDGMFLEGLDLAQEGFEDWLRDIRQAPPVHLVRHAAPTTDRSPTAVLPRIAVLPFGELATGDLRGIGDALACELTSAFARCGLIDAISHFSSRSAAPDVMRLDQLVAGLEADYALSGHCRLSGDTMTVDVTLFDLSTSKAIWSDRLRASCRAFLAGDDRLAGDVMGQCLRMVMSSATAISAQRPIPQIQAHILMMAAVSRMHAFQRQHFEEARGQLQEVIARAPTHSVPLAWLAQWHLLRVFQKWSEDSSLDGHAARAAVNAALDLNPECPLSIAIEGNISAVLYAEFETGRDRFLAAQDINPSSAIINQLAAVPAIFLGKGEEAVSLTERAYLLSPRDPRRPFFQTLAAGAYVAGARYDKAVELAEASLRHNPLHLSAHRARVIGLQMSGREKDARAAARQLLALDPDMRVQSYMASHPAGQSAIGQTLGAALREAGIPFS